jgi:hypothetical protein
MVEGKGRTRGRDVVRKEMHSNNLIKMARSYGYFITVHLSRASVVRFNDFSWRPTDGSHCHCHCPSEPCSEREHSQRESCGSQA